MDIGKNIDIFAKDDNCICLVECKAAEKSHTKKSLGVSIDQYAALHKELEKSIRSHYKDKGDETKYRFRWLLVLKNIDLNENDYTRAEKANIMVVDDSLIQYYAELSKHFGHASRYQFFADLYEFVMEMLELDKIIFVCGLDGDFQRKKFGSILDIIPLADEVVKVNGICNHCKKRKSLFTHRIVKEGGQIVVGNDNLYMALCRPCYRSLN